LGHAHDYNFGSKMMSKLPVNAVGVMELGWAKLKFIQKLVQEHKYFVLGIKNNWKLEFQSESRLTKICSLTNAQA
jgi:putative transposase